MEGQEKKRTLKSSRSVSFAGGVKQDQERGDDTGGENEGELHLPRTRSKNRFGGSYNQLFYVDPADAQQEMGGNGYANSSSSPGLKGIWSSIASQLSNLGGGSQQLLSGSDSAPYLQGVVSGAEDDEDEGGAERKEEDRVASSSASRGVGIEMKGGGSEDEDWKTMKVARSSEKLGKKRPSAAGVNKLGASGGGAAEDGGRRSPSSMAVVLPPHAPFGCGGGAFESVWQFMWHRGVERRIIWALLVVIMGLAAALATTTTMMAAAKAASSRAPAPTTLHERPSASEQHLRKRPTAEAPVLPPPPAPVPAPAPPATTPSSPPPPPVVAPPPPKPPALPVLPDLFVEMLGVEPEDVDDKIKTTWDQVFRGDAATQAVYYETKDGMAYILNTEGPFVTSEGMSYGMMITAQMGKRAEFGRLWKWTKAHMLQKDGDYKGLLGWKVAVNGTILSPIPAPDAETYVATALMIADAKWGPGGNDAKDKGATTISPDGDGAATAPATGAGGGIESTYLPDAVSLITTISDPVRGFFNPDGQVIFAPDAWGRKHSNPSYHLPAFFEMWARVFERKGIANAAFWHKAAQTSRAFLQRAVDPQTGLAPDYTELGGKPAQDLNGHGNFQYDAWRVGANTAMDWAWWGQFPWEKTHADTLQNFFMTQGIKSYPAIFSLHGSFIPTAPRDHSIGLLSMNAVLSMAATRRGTAAAFVEELWYASPPTGQYRYFGSMLYTMALLHVAGRFAPVPGLVAS